ncbi:MAG TPA: hypothetical protein VG963_29500, partial [Polyangiaceae bacterium]|nr:hypothetical protein [Polyangiaceae bacterium]
MATLIHERVELARLGRNPMLITRLASGWAVLGDSQFPFGYCLLLPDPVVPSLNDLGSERRARFLLDMAAIGDALLANTGACRINYEIQGNTERALHAHIFARHADEEPEYARGPVWRYGTARRAAVPFDAERHGALQRALALSLERAGFAQAAPGSEPRQATFEGRHSQLEVRRPKPGVVVLTISGSDVGEHGPAPFRELDQDLAAGPF